MTAHDLALGALSDLQAIALTAWAEARGDRREGHSSVEERLAVMWVIRNRARDARSRWPRTIARVCLQPWQFSCWNAGEDANHRAVMAMAVAVLEAKQVDPLYAETEYLAAGVVTGRMLDRTGGANHYLTQALYDAAPPAWATKKPPAAIIGTQVFFAL